MAAARYAASVVTLLAVSGAGCTARPVDLSAVPFSCKVDEDCREGLVCRRSWCVVPGSADDLPELCLTPEQTRCAGICTDLLRDARNCGQCGISCELGSACGAGACTTLDPQWANWPVPPEVPPATAFTIDGGTALDTQTGVMWQRGLAPSALPFTQAEAYCRGLELDGFTGWRLPSIIEAFSVFSTGSYPAPTLNLSVFSPTDRTWTSTPASWPAGTNFVRIVVYSTTPGVVVMGAVDPTTPVPVRCVRFGAQAKLAVPHAFTLDGGVVTDAATGLSWQQTASTTAMSLPEATAHCAGLPSEVADAGWRVPNYKELLALLDVRRANPSLDPVFREVPPAFYWYFWTMMPAAWPPNAIHAMTVDFGRGTLENRDRTLKNYVRCVRP
ncbi:MAG: DUF1566 domain-containing protein [Archangium sp.]|nr:DUF1566 domain-containing protein [Archangium sp.]